MFTLKQLNHIWIVAASVVVIAVARLPLAQAGPQSEGATHSVTAAGADERVASLWPPALADPAGVRSRLAKHGFSLDATYTADVLGTVSGGLRQSTHYAGLLELATDIDFEKWIGWRGLTFHASGYQIHGTSISGENLSSLASVSNIEAYPSTRLFEAWFEQSFWGGAASLRLGQIAAYGEFFAADGGGNFINSTFGWTAISSDNLPVGGPIYPIATPGVRLAVQPTDQIKVMAGLWNGDPVGPCPETLDPGQCNRDGLDFRLKDKPLLMAEGALSYGQSEPFGSAAGILPGTIKLGGWHHFGDFDDQRLDRFGGRQALTGQAPFQHTGNHGIYGVIDQMIFRLPGDGRNVSLFARAAFSPSDRNQIDMYFDGGVTVTGPFAARPSDVFGIAFAYSKISDAAAGFDRDAGTPVIRSHEAVLEISYSAELLPGLNIMPDFQYFWNPGGRIPDEQGREAIKDAAVLGVRTVVTY